MVLIKYVAIVAISSVLLFSVLQADEMDDRVREIAHNLRCPTCQAMSVKESEAGLSLNMKQKIREMLEEGKSEEEILRFFEERYGEWILRSPKKRGFNLLLWVLPGIAVLVALFFVFKYMRKMAYRPGGEKLTPLSEKEKAQIEKDLKQI